jgi:hypothetical protein
MPSRTSPSLQSRARAGLSAGLVVGTVGLVVEYVSEPGRFPTVPPGPLIPPAAAAVVALVPGRGTPAVGLLAAVRPPTRA